MTQVENEVGADPFAGYSDAQLIEGGLLIDGKSVSQSTGGTMPHVNPATAAVQTDFPVAGVAEIDAAVASARSALSEWATWAPEARRDALWRLADILRANSAAFSRVTTLENGLPVMMADLMANFAASWFDYYGGWVDKLTGDVVPTGGSFDYTLREPIGVVAILLTWNGPTALIGMKVAAALAAGCSVVLKPPELSPFSGTLFGRLVLEAGIPPGVVNVVPCGPEVGEHLVRHPGIDKISYTGSPQTAARIQAAAAENVTPLVLELGGKSANVVFADADIESVAMSAAMGIASQTGQVCLAPTRLIVESSAYDDVLESVVATLQSLKVGDPWDPATFMGPMISDSARARVLTMTERAVSTGAGKLVTGGQPLSGGDLGDGFYLAPTVLGDVDQHSEVAQTEAFGPLLSVLRFDSLDEAVSIANNTRYGLAAYLHTRDLARALQVAGRLDAGSISVNSAPPIPGPAAPFGGFKDSGYGKEGGLEGLLEFVRIKNVNIALPT